MIDSGGLVRKIVGSWSGWCATTDSSLPKKRIILVWLGQELQIGRFVLMVIVAAVTNRSTK